MSSQQQYKVAMLGWFKPAPDVEEQIFGGKVDVIGPDQQTHKYDIQVVRCYCFQKLPAYCVTHSIYALGLCSLKTMMDL